MSFYQLNKTERQKLVTKISNDILSDIEKATNKKVSQYFSDDDTYIRKTAYLAIGKIYKQDKKLKK